MQVEVSKQQAERVGIFSFLHAVRPGNAEPIWLEVVDQSLEQTIRWTCPGFVEGLGLGIRVSCLTTFCPPVWWHSFVRPPAEPFFHPGPHENAAVARSGGQGRPHFGAARRAWSKSSAYLTHSPLPSFQFLCSTWNPVSSPHVMEAGARRGGQGRPSLCRGRTLGGFQAAP